MIMILNLHTFLVPETLTWKTINYPIILKIISESLSICAVNTFVLISGYYSIKWKWKGFFSLVYQVYFFVFLIYIFLLAIGFIQFSWTDLFFRSTCLTHAYWFITSYIVLYVLAPILNVFINNVTKKQLTVFLIAFFSLEFYFSTLGVIFDSGYSPLHFIGLYLIGQYLRKYPPEFSHSKTSSLLLYFIMTLCIAILFTANKILSGNTKTYFYLIGGCYSNPFVILQSVALFFIFKNITFHNKIVNWCSISTLSVYLSHMHPDLKQLYYSHTASLYNLNIFNRFIHLFILFTVIFILSILIDKIRICSFNFICLLIDKHKNMHKDALNMYKTK